MAVFFSSGGMGARPTKDGLSTTSFPSGIATSPVEITESTSSLVFRRKELVPDSGGAGKYRGGLGQRIEVEVRGDEPFVVSSLSDRLKFPAGGYLGGKPGSRGNFATAAGDVHNPKLSLRLEAGASYLLELPGGGGFFDPAERDLSAVLDDVAEGLVTPEGALRDYGVDVEESAGDE